MLDHLTATTPRGEAFSNLLHFLLAAAFGLMGLHAALRILTHLT